MLQLRRGTCSRLSSALASFSSTSFVASIIHPRYARPFASMELNLVLICVILDAVAAAGAHFKLYLILSPTTPSLSWSLSVPIETYHRARDFRLAPSNVAETGNVTAPSRLVLGLSISSTVSSTKPVASGRIRLPPQLKPLPVNNKAIDQAYIVQT